MKLRRDLRSFASRAEMEQEPFSEAGLREWRCGKGTCNYSPLLSWQEMDLKTQALVMRAVGEGERWGR